MAAKIREAKEKPPVKNPPATQAIASEAQLSATVH